MENKPTNETTPDLIADANKPQSKEKQKAHNKTVKRMVIQESTGFMSVQDLRDGFEHLVTHTAALKDSQLTPVMKETSFKGYANPVTHMLWLGFALGVRLRERYYKAGKK